jgi:hypothetical protein
MVACGVEPCADIGGSVLFNMNCWRQAYIGAVSVEASSAYLEAATKEADRLVKDRITYHHEGTS